MATQVCLNASGLRVVAGDFNVGEDDVTAFNILHATGFKDLQTLAWERWGYSISNTCKSSTRVDFCYISPELQQLLVRTTIDPSIWPDHAVLAGFFKGTNRDIPRYVWRQPQPVAWPQFEVHPVQAIQAGQETAQYRQMWAVIEETASRASPVPIGKASRGRAQTLKPRKVVGHAHAPLRAPRAGDVQPSYFGISLKHAHWYRQVRRLQAFVRFVKVRRPTADPSHAGSTWGAIKRAKGFEPSFADWWRHSTTRVHGAPAELPEHPPDHGVAQTIYDTCLLALRKLELDLRRSSRAHAKARRLANPQLIFQDIRVPGPESLDLLICPTQAKVIHVDADMGCIQVDASRAWDLTHPVYVDGHPYDVVHHEEDWLWLDPMNQLSIGNVCTQVKFTGALEDLFAEFQTTWSKRWDRHKHVPESQWNDILQFAQKFARPIQCVSGPMTEADVRAELRRKKTRTAKGLDGVSLADLKHMPSGVIQSYCRFFEHAELCGCWPRQLAVGRVASIAKTPTPTGAADCRPITVLSLGYRVWSSFHSRNLIAALDPWLPAGLFGSRLACHSGHVWSSILLAIEEANECAIPQAGVVCDIEKAFNCLSRTVVFAIATLLQMPMNVLTGWAGMLTQVSRHFEVRQSLSPATYSCTGFPEGDGLSVVAMILLDCALHWWMEEGTRLCRTLTYVDDWQMLLQDPNHVTHAMQNLEHFCRMVDLNLDRKKTYVWCLTREGRQMLRSQGYHVGHGGRNLGAHLQLTRQHTNSTLQERARSLTELWGRLRLSSSPYKLKVRALTVAAWPKGLHGVASTALGSHWIARLRSGAMRGLQADGAGCSP